MLSSDWLRRFRYRSAKYSSCSYRCYKRPINNLLYCTLHFRSGCCYRKLNYFTCSYRCYKSTTNNMLYGIFDFLWKRNYRNPINFASPYRCYKTMRFFSVYCNSLYSDKKTLEAYTHTCTLQMTSNNTYN